jgi:phosphoglycerol transferase MdoB-like AlkP superfamily enzyme
MIQRVQTLFLLIVALLSGFMIFYPLSEMVIKTGDMVQFHSYGLQEIKQGGDTIHYNFLLLILILFITIMSFVTLLLYNNRALQMRLCVYNILISFCLIGCIAYFYFSLKHKYDIGANSYTIAVIFPIINIILLFQSFRAIRRDDLLIKSYDRLR